jgi:hypothetical protein
MTTPGALSVIPELAVSVQRDPYSRTLLGELAETLQEVVGLEEASGFASVVEQRTDDRIGGFEG